MQSDDEDTTLHSCFDSLKTAVMGCCYSICHKDSDPQEQQPNMHLDDRVRTLLKHGEVLTVSSKTDLENTVNERTHLLEVTEQQQETPAPAASASTPPKKPDEQSALNRILHETATNVIDVGALGPYALEAGAYSERVRVYGARVAALGAAGGAAPRLLADLPPHERAATLSQPPLHTADKELITNAVKKAAAALSELRVKHLEDLVVPFRVP